MAHEQIPTPIQVIDAGQIERGSYPNNLVAAFLRTAEKSSSGVLFYSDEQIRFVAYREWFLQVKKVLGGLQAIGLKSHDRVLLQISNQFDLLSAFWACILGGMIPCIVATPHDYENSPSVLDKIVDAWEVLEKPAVIISEDVVKQYKEINSPVLNEINLINLDNLSLTSSENYYTPQPSEIAFIQLSSGSTGKSKAIPMRHQGLIDCTINLTEECAMQNEQVSLNWMPLDHVGGVMVFHIPDIVRGNLSIQVTTDYILQDPLRWLDFVKQYKVTRSFSPNFAFRLIGNALEETTRTDFDLSTIQVLVNGGEACTKETVELFIEKTRPFGFHPEALVLVFGMAEICTIATANRFNSHAFLGIQKNTLNSELNWATLQTPATEILYFANLGKFFPGFKARIVDDTNQPLPDKQIGRLQFYSSRMTPGYLNNPEANAQGFTPDGWFDSGDLGFIHEGQLFVTGRAKEVVVIRGHKFPPHEIEEIVYSINGVKKGFSAACGILSEGTGTEELLVFYVPADFSKDQSGIVAQIEKELLIKLGLAPLHVIPLQQKEFPRTTSGKIQRTKLKKLFQEGKIKIPQIQQKSKELPDLDIKMADVPLFNAVLEIFQHDLHKKIDPDRSFYELGIDSISIATIHGHLQNLVKHQVPIALFFQYPTVKSLAQHLTEEQAKG